MGVTTRLALFATGLVAVFAAMFGVGSLAGPLLPEGAAPQAVTGTPGGDTGPEQGDDASPTDH
ncbi:hypothetical protein BJF83_12195 [Nocardiopsis sp. CNR-923]|uniref:hypothetical protein n=1 Tax=Nocardiopsis sp. CNR-923 TaxID=1904965 RepID=UPI00095E00D7|nr:hypothetical protein [Nocardiopsis sp. CNR-923]OLT29335.1 hypothetical protein BJF83_12195 [Nocardiopsis sp. CNR-923]